jgi:hypothetical protein
VPGIAINPMRPGQVGPGGSFMPNAGMSVQQLVAAALGQEIYGRERQQQASDSAMAAPGNLMGLLRGGVAPGMAQAAAGQQLQGIPQPGVGGVDPFLDSLAANAFQREQEFQINERILEHLAANQPGFWDKFGAPILTGAGMAIGGPLGGMAGAQLGGSAGNLLAQLVANRY